jgi:septal ring factor EnvC (AmiA/AmiB activator)
VALLIRDVSAGMTNKTGAIMDANQLRELASNAQLDHWPPHLGVVSEADKIQHLAERLREVADAETRADELADELAAAQEESNEFERQLEAANAEIYDLTATIKELRAKLA